MIRLGFMPLVLLLICEAKAFTAPPSPRLTPTPIRRIPIVSRTTTKRTFFRTVASFTSSTQGGISPSTTTGDTDEEVQRDAPAPSQINWKEQWYPLAFDKLTQKDLPFGITVLGQPLAVFWDHVAERWRAVADQCPHRLSPLSEGRVDDAGRIECPYHGWCFDGATGACGRIPQAEPGSRPPDARCDATPYPIVVSQGMLWVWMQPFPGRGSKALERSNTGGSGESSAGGRSDAWPDESLIPVVSDLPLDPKVALSDFSRDVPMDYETLMENALDGSHVSFAHHGRVGMSGREKAGPMPVKLDAPLSLAGFSGHSDLRAAKLGTPERRSEFRAPQCATAGVIVPGLTTTFLFYALPMKPGQSRILSRFCVRVEGDGKKAPFAFQVVRAITRRTPTWLQHFNSNDIIDDDNIFLHHMERKISAAGGVWKELVNLRAKADLYVSLFRDWKDRHGGGGPFGPFRLDPGTPDGAPMSHEDILDRYQQHTRHCLACTGALRNIERAMPALTVLGSLAAMVAMCGLSDAASFSTRHAMAGILCAACGAAYAQCSRWRSGLIRGPYPAKRNRI